MIQKTQLFILILLFAPALLMAENKLEAEVIHWWISGSEGAALDVVSKAFEKKGYLWVDTPVKTSYEAKTAAVSRMLDGVPPTMVQWHAGNSLLELYEEGLLRDIDELSERHGWKKVIPEALWNNISVDGHIVAAPLTVHGANWIWANKKVLEQSQVEMVNSWSEFLQVAPKIQQAGYIPLALGGQPWQERVLFLTVLLDSGGSTLYKDTILQHKPEALGGKQMAEVFAVFGSLRPFIDDKSPGRSWSDSTKLVIDGKAAFIIMGDWAKGEFFQEGKILGEDFLCALSPGSGSNYLLVADTFAMTKVATQQQQKMQEELVLTLMDPLVQKEFNRIKGSIPPRTDVDLEDFDQCSQLAKRTITDGQGETMAGFNMANKGLIGSSMMDIISTFWNDPEMTPQQAAKAFAEAVAEANF